MRPYNVVRTLPPGGLPALIVLFCVLGMALQTITWSRRQQQAATAPSPAAATLSPVAQSSATLRQEIDRAQLFGVPPAAEGTLATAPAESPPITLRGVLAGLEPALAILDVAGEQRAYRIGDTLYDDARLVVVEPQAVVIQRGPQRQVLPLEVAEALPRPAQAQSVPATDAAEADAEFGDLEALLGGVAVTPVYDERGRLAGYRLMPQIDDAMLSQMGMTREELEAEAELVTAEGDPEFVAMLQQMRGDPATGGAGAP